MDGVAFNEVPKRIRAEEHAAADLDIINTAVKNVISQRLRAYSEHLRGSGDIEQTLKLVLTLQGGFGGICRTWLGGHRVLIVAGSSWSATDAHQTCDAILQTRGGYPAKTAAGWSA